MRSRYFENKARRSFWSVHIEGWRKSGWSRARYCREHRLTVNTFGRWLAAIGDAEALSHKAPARRRRTSARLSADKRNRAVQAFWAMHIEALTWCGLGVAAYARAHHLSPHSLRRWRDLIEGEALEIDWRARLHPSALPRLSTGRSTGAKTSSAENGLTDAAAADPPSRRRSFTLDEKHAIVLETEAPGVSVAAVARRHGVAASMVFRWRVRFGLGREKPVELATVRAPGGPAPGALVLRDLLPVPNGLAAVDLSDGRRVFAPAGADPDAVRRQVERGEMGP